jgi:hypothetical protein
MEALRFFEEMFGAMLSDGIKMTVWTPRDGATSKTAYFEQVEAAAQYADSIKDTNVYFGLGVTKADLPENKRPSALQICGIPGFWIDIDIADSGAHKASNLPQSQQDAEELISSAIPRHMQPTILTHSGHGLHAYWLFKEPWIFESEEERIQAASLMQRFVLSFKFHAAMRGWKLDSVFDLARVLRVPGSINHKVPGMPMTCRIISIKSDMAYLPEDFEPFFVADDAARSDDGISELLSKEKNPLNLRLSAFATPPFTKFETLSSLEDRFRRAWNLQRADFKDQTLSSYDMSIATYCASYRWADQEIADTLIAFRMKHAKSDNEKKKAMRIDYITRTILRAKTKKKDEDQDENLTAILAQSSHAQAGEAAPPSAKQLSEVLKTVLKVEIAKIIKYQGDDPQFELVLADGTGIMLGGVDGLICQKNLRNTLAAHKGVIIKQMKGPVWDDYATLLLNMAEIKAPAKEDNTQKGSLEATIKQYLERVGVMNNHEHALHGERPFKKGDRIYMFSTAFRMWTKLHSDPLTKKELAIVATSIGIETTVMKFSKEVDGALHYTTRSVYDITKFAQGCNQNEMPGLYEIEPEQGVGAVQ